jgi:hypothetical protein
MVSRRCFVSENAEVVTRGNVVNKLKGDNAAEWNAQSQFDAEKDKVQFRKYEEACARVKAFYKEQHGVLTFAGSYMRGRSI